MLSSAARILSGQSGRFKITFARTFGILSALLILSAGYPAIATAQDGDLTLRMSDDLKAAGLDKQLFPRFGFKHRIRVIAVTEGDADLALGTDVEGAFVFRDGEGVEYLLDTGGDPRGETLLEWMRSGPGQAAIHSFAPDGQQVFFTEIVTNDVVVEEVFDGNTKQGSDLAILHCGRCHVVDKRNRMGGIGSTPSFAALRGRENWSELFRAFYTHNPHPSFTQVEGLTEPFDPNHQVHIAPVEITLDDVEAITAFVATIKPKDLGRPVQAN